MLIENFRDFKKVNGTSFATVDVWQGWLCWRRKVSKMVFKEGLYWRDLETGRFTPGYLVESLHAAYMANNILKNEK